MGGGADDHWYPADAVLHVVNVVISRGLTACLRVGQSIDLARKPEHRMKYLQSRLSVATGVVDGSVFGIGRRHAPRPGAAVAPLRGIVMGNELRRNYLSPCGLLLVDA